MYKIDFPFLDDVTTRGYPSNSGILLQRGGGKEKCNILLQRRGRGLKISKKEWRKIIYEWSLIRKMPLLYHEDNFFENIFLNVFYTGDKIMSVKPVVQGTPGV